MSINWSFTLENTFEKKAGIVFFILFSIFSAFCIYISNMWSILFAFIPFSLFISSIIYFWGGADNFYEYSLTENEISYSMTQVVPESLFKAIRVFSYFGIAVCFVAGVVLGPLAFAGAGAMALMSFKLTNVKPQNKEDKIEIAEKYLIKHIKGRGKIYLFSRSGNSRRQDGIVYCSPEFKGQLLDELTKLMKEYEIIEVNHWREV